MLKLKWFPKKKEQTAKMSSLISHPLLLLTNSLPLSHCVLLAIFFITILNFISHHFSNLFHLESSPCLLILSACALSPPPPILFFSFFFQPTLSHIRSVSSVPLHLLILDLISVSCSQSAHRGGGGGGFDGMRAEIKPRQFCKEHALFLLWRKKETPHSSQTGPKLTRRLGLQSDLKECFVF